MENKYILSLDSGTTSARTLIIDQNANVVSIAQQEFTQFFPEPGWVEHNASEIWSVQFATMIQAIQQENIDLKDIKAIGVTNQRETVVIWDKVTGIPVHNAIVWQDKRTSEYCEELKKIPGLLKKIQKKTGLLIDPYFSGTKIKWLLDNVKGLRQRAEKGEILVGTIDTWLMWKLTDGKTFATDVTNASRTLLYNIIDLKWDDELLKLFDIPKNILPEVKNSSDDYGVTTISPVEGLKIYSAIGDQQSALYGHRSKKGEIKGTYGTGAFLMLNTGDEPIVSENGLLTTIAIGINGKVQYALEGSIYIAGNVLKWLKEELHLIQEYEQIDYYVKGDNDTKGVIVVPYFVGVGAPYWNSEVRGMITGLTRGTTRKHLVKAAAHSIAYQTKDIFNSFEQDFGKIIKKMSIDGGVAQGAELMQFQANILDVALFLPKQKEVTALGTAYLAGLKAGVWKDEKELDSLLEYKTIFYPQMLDEDRDEIYGNWQRAVKAALVWRKS